MAEKIQYLLIDSKYRTSGNSEDFILHFQPALQAIKSIELISVSLPYIHYNVNESNNKIYFTQAATPYTATITPGVYDNNSIDNAIVDAMIAASGNTFTANYNLLTYYIEITSNVSFSLDFSNTTDSAAYLLGFNDEDYASALIQIGVEPSHLSTPPYFFINLSNVPHAVKTNNGVFGTFIITTTTNSGGQNFHFVNTQYNYKINSGIGPFQTVTVQLRDPDGAIFDIRNTDYHFLLKLTYQN